MKTKYGSTDSTSPKIRANHITALNLLACSISDLNRSTKIGACCGCVWCLVCGVGCSCLTQSYYGLIGTIAGPLTGGCNCYFFQICDADPVAKPTLAIPTPGYQLKSMVAESPSAKR